MAFTVVPLHNLHLPRGTKVPFGNDFFLQDIPAWVKEDKGILADIAYHDRQAILEGRHALVAEYDANSIGQPDPSWPNKSRRSIQDSKTEAAVLANLAMWLQQPSTVCFTASLHAIMIIQSVEPRLPLLCHPNDIKAILDQSDVLKAAQLYTALSSIPRKNSVWTAMRTLWLALTTYEGDMRYSFLWIALEALFGDEGPSGEIIHKLAERIAFFLGNSPVAARELYQKAKKSYENRSKIVHGRFNNDSDIDAALGDTEAILRSSFRRLLDAPDLLQTFVSNQRNSYLRGLIFSRITNLELPFIHDPNVV